MATVTFYRQVRVDGGARTGIEAGGNTVFSRFEPGARNADPALLWYVDITCTGTGVPAGHDRARDWLIRHAPTIIREIKALAETLAAGMDFGDWPLQRAFRIGASVRVTIKCSAIRRMTAQRIGDVLNDIAEHWVERIEELDTVQAQ